MPSTSTVSALAERLCRPQRIGVFGHRGVGKTTLLTMLYREAVGGRLPGLRLAAGDAATANYLADKILQLEAGDVLPATLTESQLRFQIYREGSRVELVLRDYQGEHVELGRQESIRDFLRDCDAVWLCLDPALLDAPEQCLRGQQEVEQVVEDYLALEPPGNVYRPMALVLTKADLLPVADAISADEHLTGLFQRHFSMALHALRQHSPSTALLAVSSLGPRTAQGLLQPLHLERPLLWLVESLQAQDEARLERLFSLAAGKVGLLARCVACFVKRYPHAARGIEFQRRLRELIHRRRRRRLLFGVAAVASLLLGLWGYDTAAFYKARRGDASDSDPTAARQGWEKYVAGPLSMGARRESAEKRMRELDEEIGRRDRAQRFAELSRRAADDSADPKAVWQQFVSFHASYPDTAGLSSVRDQIEGRLKPVLMRDAQRAHDDLLKAEQRLPATDARSSVSDRDAARQRLEDLVAHADRFLKDFDDPSLTSRVRETRDGILRRIDEHDFETARTYSRREPLNFQTRRLRYQAYLDRHPRGAFEKQARAALAEVEAAWDKHDFRAVRDHFQEKPAELAELLARCERYLAVHPEGQYRSTARALMRWSEGVKGEREYKVVAERGEFSGKLGRWYTRGPDLSVAIEVNGVRYGPSGFIKNHYNPRWNYEFPRPVRWKMGDRVRVIVKDHDFWGRTVLDHTSDEKDMLSMRLLNGALQVGGHTLWFKADFEVPSLPKID